MLGELTPLIAGLLLFHGMHLATGFLPVRSRLAGMMGEELYKGFVTLVSLGGLLLIIWGVSVCPFIIVWHTPVWAEALAIALMPFSIILVIASYISNDIRKLVRHPMMWGVILWAGSHLIANGDLGGILLFGSFLIYSFVSQILMDRKMAIADPEGWAKVEAETSLLPFVGIIQRKPFDGKGDPAWRPVVIGLFSYGVILVTHAYVFGVAAAYSIGL